MINWTSNIENNKSSHFYESSNPMKSEKIDSHFRGNDRTSECHSCESKNPELILFISIATTFKSLATIAEQLLALAKYKFSILAKAQFSSLIYPRPEDLGYSTLLFMSLN